MSAKILVLDNDQSNAEAIQAVLEDESFDVVSITSLNELEPSIKGFCPDLIVMDILLDTGDGREICNLIKLNQNTSNIPVILITAMLEAQAYKIPSLADGIIFKPFDNARLYSSVRRLIR